MNSLFQNKPEPYDLSNFTILLVEDSEYMQSLILEMLKLFGIGDILRCKDSQEAIDLISITHARKSSRHIDKIDIVLTDWLMPKGSGKELVKWVRHHKVSDIRFLPLIVVSGYTTERLTHETRDLGIHELLVKPVSGKLLASRICSVIDSPRPFIQTQNYFGPDRRRQELTFHGPEKRLRNPHIVERDM
ncbi:MAG: response regulator [Alphaproteobacteria bacterium]|nr:response regulator [Alphaproteobacteria bacterium]